MLKEKLEGKVISFKTTSGDEVVAKVVEESADAVKVSQPVILAASSQGLGMVPFLMTADLSRANVEFKWTNIVCHAETSQQVADAYIQNTTGIVPVRNSGIITA